MKKLNNDTLCIQSEMAGQRIDHDVVTKCVVAVPGRTCGYCCAETGFKPVSELTSVLIDLAVQF